MNYKYMVVSDIGDGESCGHAHKTFEAARKCRDKLRADNPCKWHQSVILRDGRRSDGAGVYRD